MAKTVRDIVTEYLRANGYDGLCNAHYECECSIGILFACGEYDKRCTAGHKVSARPYLRPNIIPGPRPKGAK